MRVEKSVNSFKARDCPEKVGRQTPVDPMQLGEHCEGLGDSVQAETG